VPIADTPPIRFRVDKRSETIWRIFLETPPPLPLEPKTIAHLDNLLDHLEGREHVKVLIFEPAPPVAAPA
jgi:hypothetical protein